MGFCIHFFPVYKCTFFGREICICRFFFAYAKHRVFLHNAKCIFCIILAQISGNWSWTRDTHEPAANDSKETEENTAPAANTKTPEWGIWGIWEDFHKGAPSWIWEIFIRGVLPFNEDPKKTKPLTEWRKWCFSIDLTETNPTHIFLSSNAQYFLQKR